MKMKLSAITLAILPAFANASASVDISKAAKPGDYSNTSVIVAYKDDSTTEMRRAARLSVGARIADDNKDEMDDKLSAIAGGRLAVYDLSRMSAKQAISKLSNDPAIAYAEHNYRVKTAFTPDDTRYTDLWAMNNTGQNGGTVGVDISAEEAWDITTGDRSVVVAVVDTGVDHAHPDLNANMWSNPNEIAGNGIDDDNNGYVDDIHGINAITNVGDPMDDQGHGSHVAGTMGAVGNNGVGVVGVNHETSIIGCKFLAADGFGSTANAIKCINYLVALKNSGVNLRVINHSWGGGGYSQALKDAIQASEDAGILSVIAAGNGLTNRDVDANPEYPGSYDNEGILTIANTTRTDSLNVQSKYGANNVDMGAPGSAILSTTPGNSYATYSGTSMASPHVAGAAAMISAVKPNLNPLQVKEILMNSGDVVESLNGKTVTGKRLNLHQALLDADPDPSFTLAVENSDVTITAGETAVYTFTVGALADWTGDVALSISSATMEGAVLSTDSASPGETFTLSVPTTAETNWGAYQFQVKGTSGEIVKTIDVDLYVNPQGLTDTTYENTTPVDIPDNSAEGVTSIINVPYAITTFGVSTNVNITHTYIGDLRVTLTSPTGTTHVLHDRTGGGTDNIDKTYTTDAFNGQIATGDWKLNVSDNASRDTGTLNSWSLTITGIGEITQLPPVAGFSYVANLLAVTFTDSSTDPNNDITTWAWDFGDGNTSTEQSPTHTYAADGTYTVGLTVTDSEGHTNSTSMEVSVVSIAATAEIKRAYKTRMGRLRVDIKYENVGGEMVDVYRNGTKIGTAPNNGTYRDRQRRVTGNSFTYKVCESGNAENCSNEVTASFD